jgi:hypothetical protein
MCVCVETVLEIFVTEYIYIYIYIYIYQTNKLNYEQIKLHNQDSGTSIGGDSASMSW